MQRTGSRIRGQMVPLICWSFSSSIFKYLFVDQAVPAMWRSLAAARLRADCPSGNAPTTRVRRLISRNKRSSGLLVRMRRQADCALSVLRRTLHRECEDRFTQYILVMDGFSLTQTAKSNAQRVEEALNDRA